MTTRFSTPSPHTHIHIGCAEFLAALRAGGHEVTHLRSHDAGTDFPFSIEELNAYDVVILSDIGANTLLLPPEVFEQGQRRPNRLKVLREWVHAGGGLMMAGGYLSFQGFRAMANYAGTPLEDALPVSLSRWDDRIETPEGAHGHLSGIAHPITDGLDKQWPYLLGYQRLTPDADATVLATIEGDPLLAVKEYGRGRSAAYATDISRTLGTTRVHGMARLPAAFLRPSELVGAGVGACARLWTHLVGEVAPGGGKRAIFALFFATRCDHTT